MKRNITLLFLYGFLIKRFAFPIIVIYYLAQHLSFTQIGLLSATTSITTILMEIPGGLFADRIGKKYSLIIGALMGVTYSLLLTLGNSFLPYFIASIFYGLSFAFVSGTREAILFDTLKSMNLEHTFREYTGKIRLCVQSLNALVIISVPFTYEIHEKLPFIVTLVFFSFAILVASLMLEPPNTDHDQEVVELHTYKMHFKNGFQEMHKNPYVMATILLSVTLMGFFHILSDFLQPLLQVAEIDIIYFGIFYTVLRLTQGISAALVYKLDKFMSLSTYLGLCIITIIISFLMMGQSSSYWILISILIMNSAYWMMNVLIKDEINQNIKSQSRTTILSFRSFAGNLVTAIVIIIFSSYADLIGVQETFVYTTIALSLLAGLGFWNFQKQANS